MADVPVGGGFHGASVCEGRDSKGAVHPPQRFLLVQANAQGTSGEAFLPKGENFIH